MKLNILRLVIVALACASAVLVIANVRAQKSSPAQNDFAVSLSTLGIAVRSQTPAPPAAAQEQTVEQVQKNIKVLNGMPQSQLIPAMNFFAASLGVRCNYCHANKNGQLDFASEEKAEKETAREMIKLVLDTNKNTFHGNPQVSCWTCHRGRTSPQGFPTLPLPAPTPRPSPSAGGTSQASPSPAPALPSADDLFNKYIAAIGRQAAIHKLKSRMVKGGVVPAKSNPLRFEGY